MLQVERHVQDVVVQVVDLAAGLPEYDRARRDVHHAHGAGVPLGLHEVAVRLALGDDLHLQRGAAERAAGADPLRDGERLAVGAAPLVDHQEDVVHVGLPDAERDAVLESPPPLLGVHAVAGGQVPQVPEADVGERGPPDGERDGVERKPRDRVRCAVDRVHDEDLLAAVVHVPYLLAEDVQREVVRLDVHQRRVLRDLVYLRRVGPVRAHADLLAPLRRRGDLLHGILHGVGYRRQVGHRDHARP